MEETPTMVRFIGPVLDRHQSHLLRDTLDESIPLDHPVRVYDFILDQHDWGEWNAMYAGWGRPPYPPQVMCKLLVYGYSVGIRSSRALEHACGNNVDFIRLMSGRVPDHDTIATFRREHCREFKRVFRTSVAAREEAGMVSLGKPAVDGTRVEANNAASQTKTAADLEQMLEKLDARIEKIAAEAEATDQREDKLFGPEVTPFALPKELKDLQSRQAKLRKALKKVQAKAQRAMEFKGASAEEAAKKRVPITDPDADVMKDKKKKFGPNYTPYVGVDVESGVVTSEGVTNSHEDADHLQPAIEEAEANTHKQVGQVQADSGYATPDNITYCEKHQIDPCIAPVKTDPESKKDKPQIPPWPEDVPTNAPDVHGVVVFGPSPPRTWQGKFDKSAFRYDASSDSYTCPMGHSTPLSKTKKRRRASGVRTQTVYCCSACAECPFRPVCTTNPRGRSVDRDENAAIHERQADRMREPARRRDYKLRKRTVEPTIGIIKDVFGMRRFLLRGSEYVRGEWSLAAAAFNLKKLAGCLASRDRVAVGGGMYG